MPSGSLTRRFFFNDQEAFVDPAQRQQLRPQHQSETLSTASLQTFEDSEGGLPLDTPLVQAREQQRRGRPTSRCSSVRKGQA
jgi:hypothetical protein